MFASEKLSSHSLFASSVYPLVIVSQSMLLCVISYLLISLICKTLQILAEKVVINHTEFTVEDGIQRV